MNEEKMYENILYDMEYPVYTIGRSVTQFSSHSVLNGVTQRRALSYFQNGDMRSV